MRPVLSAGVITALFLLGTASSHAATLYIDDANGNIGTFNTVTKALTVLGNSGAGLTDIGFSSSGDLYGTSFDSFYSINKSTGAASLVGNYNGAGAGGINALVGYGSGFLAASFSQQGLYQIGTSPFTVSTLSGSTGGFSAGDLAFAASGGSLYGTQTNGNLVKYEISGSSFTSSIVGNTGNTGLYGLATDLSGTTFAIAGTQIYTVDLNTGTLTQFANYGGQGLGDAYGTAFFGEASLSTVPLPASAPMFGAALIGLAGLGYAAKRKKAAAAA